MKKIISVGVASLGLAGLLTTFTNCDVYSKSDLFSETNTDCGHTGECSSQSEILELRINSQQNLPVGVNEMYLDIGGDCNEGGYASHFILWELHLGEVMQQSSQLLRKNGVCINGRFAIRVELPRAGLTAPTPNRQRQRHKLFVEIVGVDQQGRPFRNQQHLARQSLELVPDSRAVPDDR